MSIGISIVIPTFNRARLLRPTLESVGSVHIPPDMRVELLVIDNNCTDETPAIIDQAAAASPFPVKRIIEPRQGLCFGRNRGLQEARYEHVVYLDDDIEVAPDWLLGYFEAVDSLQADCVVGPVTPVFEIPPPAYMTRSIIDSVSSPYSQKGHAMMVVPFDVAHEIPGCNFGVRKSVGLQIGGFDNELDRVGKELLAGGDFEFGQRLLRSGKRVAYQPRCWIKHVITSEKLSKAYLRRRWYGAGVTARAMNRRRRGPEPVGRRARYTLGALRLAIRAACARVLSSEATAFQLELEARQALGYLHEINA